MTHRTKEQIEALIEQKEREKRCDGCGRTTDDLVKCWDEELCPECYRQHKENERINKRDERKER